LLTGRTARSAAPIRDMAGFFGWRCWVEGDAEAPGRRPWRTPV
jgi:hypothetical protein